MSSTMHEMETPPTAADEAERLKDEAHFYTFCFAEKSFSEVALSLKHVDLQDEELD